jgi:hypothetical protein
MRIVFQTLRRSGLVVLALATASASLPAQSDTIVIPAAFENADAFSNLTFPFGALDAPPSNFPFRFQQLYEASQFGDPGDVLTISAVRFRVDQPTGDREPFTVQSMEVRLGTTSKGEGELTSLEFGSNIDGGDTTLVFAGSLAWDPCNVDVCALPAFDLEIAFSPAFVYDPTAGNLIVDFTNLSETYPPQLFDATVTIGDGVSHVREVLDRDDPSQHIFVNPSTLGLVTQFVFTVPEPGALASIATALVAIAAVRRSRA